MRETPKTSLLLRLPAKQHQDLKNEAHNRGISVNRLCNERLSENTVGGVQAHIHDPEISMMLKCFGTSLLGIVLFGSTARGEQTKKSDQDLLLVLGEKEKLNRSLYHRFDELKLNPMITPQFVRLPRNENEVGSLWFEAAIDGVILHDPSGAIAKAFRDLRRRMAENRIQRLWAHGHPYWIRKDSHEKSIPGQ